MSSQLKKVREKNGFTQADVAKRAGISVRYYQRVEAGNSKPTVDVALRIASIFCCKVEELF